MPMPDFTKWIPTSGGYSGSSNITHKLITAFPLLFVNGVAFAGQYGYAHDHLKSWHTTGDAMFAIALESIAVFLAYHAYLAEKRDDSSLRLKLASYGFGLFVGWINYSHWINTNRSVAFIVGSMSASSPFLWGVYSRAVARTILANENKIERHALRLGATRWIWHPIRSTKLMSFATWEGISLIAKALPAYTNKKEEIRQRNQLRIDDKIRNNGSQKPGKEIAIFSEE